MVRWLLAGAFFLGFSFLLGFKIADLRLAAHGYCANEGRFLSDTEYFTAAKSIVSARRISSTEGVPGKETAEDVVLRERLNAFFQTDECCHVIRWSPELLTQTPLFGTPMSERLSALTGNYRLYVEITYPPGLFAKKSMRTGVFLDACGARSAAR